MTIPVVVVEAPTEWTPAAFAPPRVAESAGASLTSFRGLRSADGATLVSGCVAVPIPGWVEDMRPAVEGRTVALAGAATEASTGFPVDARPDGHDGFELRPARDLAGPVIGRARTFVGFDSSRVFSCFAACTTTGRGRPSAEVGSAVEVGRCENAIAGSRLEGSSEPPAPGLGLRGVTWAVHHPRPTVLGAGIFVFAVGLLAVLLRRRPRSA